MGRHHRFAAAALLAAAVAAGCGGAQIPQPTTPSPLPKQAPPVKEPLDAGSFQADACRSLTELQRSTLGLARGSNNMSEQVCVLSSADQRIVVKVNFSRPSSSSGLEWLYESHSRGTWGFWEPTEIDGYPAVAFEVSPAETKVACQIAVGLSDSSDFSVEYRFRPAATPDKQPCVEVRSVASLVLSTVKAAT